MKKLLIAIVLVFITAAFEQKAAIVYKAKNRPTYEAVSKIDSLINKIETLNNLKRYEK